MPFLKRLIFIYFTLPPCPVSNSNDVGIHQTLSEAFDKWGVTCVEHIKLLPRDDFFTIFEDEKFIVKETAKIVYEKLHETPFDLSRASLKRESDIFSPPPAIPPSNNEQLLATSTRLGPLLALDQTKTPNFKSLGTGTAQQVESIARMWCWKGHQTNFVRLAVAEVLATGVTKTELARVIRGTCNDSWDGIVNNGNDKVCKRIMATLVRIDKLRKEGKLEDITPSQSKSLVKGARGAKKGVKRGPYKKRQSAGAQPEIEEVIEHVVAEHDTLGQLGEANIDTSGMNAALAEEVHQDEAAEEQQCVTIESI